MHTVSVNLIADQEIKIGGKRVNVHDIYSVKVNGEGVIINAYVEPEGCEEYDYMARAKGSLLSDEEEARLVEFLDLKVGEC